MAGLGLCKGDCTRHRSPAAEIHHGTVAGELVVFWVDLQGLTNLPASSFSPV